MRQHMNRSVRAFAAASTAVTVAVLGTTGAAAAAMSAVEGATQTCTTTSASAQAAASAYLDALVSHDASVVPFAPDVLRIENGLVTGRSANEIRTDLNTSLKYKVISGLRNRIYSVGAPTADGTVAVDTDYLLDVGSSSFTLLTVRIKERFDLRCELITHIKATVGLP